MANVSIPRIPGESSLIHTREAAITITLNADGATYQILMDGTPYKPAQDRKWVIEFIEGMLKDDFNLSEKGNTLMEEVVLQIWKAASGQYGGRILRGSVEDGRVAGCASKDDVECQALDAGIEFDRVEVLDEMPPVK